MHPSADSGSNAPATCTEFLIVVSADATQTSTRMSPRLDPHTLLPVPADSPDRSASASWCSTSGHVIARLWPASAVNSAQSELQVVAGWQVSVGSRRIGRYCEIDLDPTGRGVIRQDPYGLHPLYFANVRDTTIVANRSHLVALAHERLTGRSPGRDRRLAAWLALGGYPIGDRTGYECVHCVPFVSAVHVRSDYTTEIRSERPPWLVPEVRDVERRLDQVESELVENLRAVVSAAPDKPLLQLTGGRDSRLVLALAVRANVLKDVEAVTYGPPDNIDAVLARELTSRLGVPHSQLRWKNSAVSDLCGHVDRVAGALNCADSTIAPDRDHRVSLSGLIGETMRTTWPKRQAGRPCLESTVKAYLSAYMGGTCLLRRDASVAALNYGLECLLEPAGHATRSEDFLDAFSIQHRIRRRVSVRPVRFAREFFPLYHPPAVDLAFGMGWADRVYGLIHNEIIRRAGRAISDVDYGKPRGRYRLDNPILDAGTKRYAFPAMRAAISLGNMLGHSRQRSREGSGTKCELQVAERIDKAYASERPLPLRTDGGRAQQPLGKLQSVYKELIHARERNPMFEEVVERERLLKCVERLPELTHAGSLGVHGAMTGVIWLGRLEKEAVG